MYDSPLFFSVQILFFFEPLFRKIQFRIFSSIDGAVGWICFFFGGIIFWCIILFAARLTLPERTVLKKAAYA